MSPRGWLTRFTEVPPRYFVRSAGLPPSSVPVPHFSPTTMTKNRLEAFSDGVLAIVITIMVLEMKVPHDASGQALIPIIPVFLSYVLSFVYLGIYWNNHHHLLHAAHKVSGAILWANLHLLFWLSLIPFVTGWMGENHFARNPTLLYGAVLILCAVAYFILQNAIIAAEGRDSALAKAIGADRKGWASLGFYALALLVGLKFHQVSLALYIIVALMWLIPDRRIETALSNERGHKR